MALIGLFSLSLITMAVATARAADLSATMWVNGLHDPTYLWLWSAIESCIGMLMESESLLTMTADNYLQATAIIVSCLSAFPQLFTSSHPLKKPVYRPTDTYYQRLASRMKLNSTKKSAESGLYGLSAVSVSQPQPTYDSRTSDQDFETFDSQVLVPNHAFNREGPMAVCYKSKADGTQNIGSQGHIMREREYQVIHHWA